MVFESQPAETRSDLLSEDPLAWYESASAREKTADVRDVIAADRDMAAATRDHVAELRDEVSSVRDQFADVRDDVAQLRDEVASTRDQLADLRDQVADRRDRAADHRDDRDAAHRDDRDGSWQYGRRFSAGRQLHDGQESNGAPTGRHTSSDDRWQTRLDRAAATVRRNELADDRACTGLERDAALLELRAVADDRVQIGLGRDDVSAERETAAGDRRREAADRVVELERRLTWGVVLAMLAAAPDAIVAVDARGRIVYINHQAEQQFGWPPAELLGRPIEVLVPDWSAADHPAARIDHFVNLSARTTATDVALSARRYDGSEFPSEISVSVTDAGTDRWVLAAIRDVTISRQSERDLEAARATAVLADGAKDRFLSRMSHELRTPLNAIMGFAQLLAGEELNSDQEEFVGQIVCAGKHLLSMINDVLDIAEVSRGAIRVSMEPVAVRDVVEEALAMIRPLADDRELHVSDNLSSHTYMFADRLRLKEAVVNLLANAVKYNRIGGSILIDGESVREGTFRLTVTDSGIGIARADIERLFTPFERLAARPEIEGSGLGLALTKLLVTAMGGDVGVSSLVGIGSSFWIELPVSAAPSSSESMIEFEPTAPTAPTASTAPPGVKTVLCVEDNQANVTLIEHIMTRRPDVRLVVAMSGQVAIDLAFEQRPDLILLDLGLPDMSGDEVLRQLQADPRTAAIPVAVISGDAMPQRSQELLAMGASTFLTKPFDMQQFLGIIDDTLASAAPAQHES